jgi:hypothetical protein
MHGAILPLSIHLHGDVLNYAMDMPSWCSTKLSTGKTVLHFFTLCDQVISP